MGCCCCCFRSLPEESSRTIDEHVPLSRASPSSVVSSTETQNRNLVSNMLYTEQLQPPIPLAFTPRNLQSPSKLPKTESDSSQGARPITTHSVPEKETWPVDDRTDIDIKKKDRETIDECPICLEEYDIENPRLLTKCGHDFHLACILEWMERSEACPVCDKELVLIDS